MKVDNGAQQRKLLSRPLRNKTKKMFPQASAKKHPFPPNTPKKKNPHRRHIAHFKTPHSEKKSL